MEVIEATGIHHVGVYIRRHQVTTAERVSCHHIYEFCTEAERMLGTSQMV